MALADTNLKVEFARCDFRVAGITRNSVNFAMKSGLECEGESDSYHPEHMTPCMEMKDSFGACHLIVMPTQDVFLEWEVGVQRVQALPHNAPSPPGQSVDAAGGIKSLLRSLDHITSKAAVKADSFKHHVPNVHGDRVEPVSATWTDAGTPQHNTFSLGKTAGSATSSATSARTPLSAPVEEHAASEVHATRSTEDFVWHSHLGHGLHAAAGVASDRFALQQQQPSAAHSYSHAPKSSRQHRLKAQIVEHLQSLEDASFSEPVRQATLRAETQIRMAPRDAGSSSNAAVAGEMIPVAGEVMNEVAARINGALAAFANFGKK